LSPWYVLSQSHIVNAPHISGIFFLGH
jgi:hypothetical protein